MNTPKRISLANLPTKIERLDKLSKKLGKNIYFKRDDQTGLELTGNKVRKLEFSLNEALDLGADTIITCGGIQSNHARATAVACAKLGLKCHLLLEDKEGISKDKTAEGNWFLDKLVGAQLHFYSSEEFARLDELVKEQYDKLKKDGHKPYFIPIGASNAIGSFGYYQALEEILLQEKQLGIDFDTIVTTVGSAGTYAGLIYKNKKLDKPKRIVGICITKDADYFIPITLNILKDMAKLTGEAIGFSDRDIEIINGYQGRGYALSTKEEVEFISSFASMEGIFLDPTYTGKAMRGFCKELEKGTFLKGENLLFIHTGGVFGWSEQTRNLI